jgi:hypothetical protein
MNHHQQLLSVVMQNYSRIFLKQKDVSSIDNTYNVMQCNDISEFVYNWTKPAWAKSVNINVK